MKKFLAVFGVVAVAMGAAMAAPELAQSLSLMDSGIGDTAVSDTATSDPESGGPILIDTAVVDTGGLEPGGDSGIEDGDKPKYGDCSGKSVGDRCGVGKVKTAGTGPDGVYYPAGYCQECAGTLANPRVLQCTTFSLATCSY